MNPHDVPTLNADTYLIPKTQLLVKLVAGKARAMVWDLEICSIK
jgi:hypothetical protein